MEDLNQNQEENVLIHLAVIEDNLDVVKFLVKHSVPVNSRAINTHLSVEFLSDYEHRKHLRTSLGEIVANEVDVEEYEEMLGKTTTPLHLAVRSENKEIAELLLNHDAEINAEMEGGETPLVIAVLSKRKHITELLVHHGADVNARTIWGKTALHYAAQIGQEGIVELLCRNGAHINSCNEEGMTALHFAVEAGHKETVSTLLRNGANLEIRTSKGATSLLYAVVMEHKEIVELLMENGANINNVMKHGNLDLSPFNWLTHDEERKAWELLSKYTTKMNLVNWYGTMMSKLYRRSKNRKDTTSQPDLTHDRTKEEPVNDSTLS